MQCGPAPLTAVKAGDTNTGYDVGFVFSEVNGDIVYWIVEEDGDMRIARVDTSGVGKLVATKAVGSTEMVDIKHLYKAEEGSANERDAVGAAACQGARGAYLEDYYKNNTLSEEMRFSLSVGEVKLGESVVVQLEAKNTSSEPKTVKVVMTCCSCTYMGRVLGELKRMQHTLFVPGYFEFVYNIQINFVVEFQKKREVIPGSLTIQQLIHSGKRVHNDLVNSKNMKTIFHYIFHYISLYNPRA